MKIILSNTFHQNWRRTNSKCRRWVKFVCISQEALEFYEFQVLKTLKVCFNPFIPTRGVGIFYDDNVTLFCYLFQSIYTYKRRWNANPHPLCPETFSVSIHLYLQEALELLIVNSFPSASVRFNPFIPTRGVGISGCHHWGSWFLLFQSIYTYKRRWNLPVMGVVLRELSVSIHLYLQEALESKSTTCQNLKRNSFNPFIPTRGVGIFTILIALYSSIGVSIHLYLQEALELFTII